ncbi:MAG: ABC transporter ATP-binding protein [Acidiferrobacterales bacterium]
MDVNNERAGEPLVRVESLYKEFDISGGLLEQLKFQQGRIVRRKETVKAINGIDLNVVRGEAFCVVGESGCGKSTVARAIMGLLKPTSGAVYYDGQRIDNLPPGELMPYRKRMQMIFQNPYASLNPRMTIYKTLEEPIRFHNPRAGAQEVRDKVATVMQSVGVDPSWSERFPHELSGGQRQRISIARALAVDPEFIAADEPISALDVSIQAQVLNLLMDARERRALTYLLITHDLAVVEHFGTRVTVMYLGTVCEVATTRALFSTPRHPYSQALLSAIPKLGKARPDHFKLRGEVPTPINLPGGCVFHGRCTHARERCRQEVPRLISVADGVSVACHAVEEERI